MTYPFTVSIFNSLRLSARHLLFIGSWAIATPAFSQVPLEVFGNYPDGSEPLSGAFITINEEGQGITNINGIFLFPSLKEGDVVKAQFAGFSPDTVRFRGQASLQLHLQPLVIQEVEVVEAQEAIKLSNKSAGLDFQINQKELRRAACCNLSESFENNPSIDVSFADALTGTRTIEMLGLNGQYLPTQIELIPFLRGIQVRRGWAYIPGPWIESLQLSKGIGSVSNGHESMTGQLNLELRKPWDEAGNHLNLYLNGMGRSEINYTTAYPVNAIWSSATSLHASWIPFEVDRNGDQFMDLPTGHLYALLHRWKASFNNGWESQFGFRWVDDLQEGGQLANVENADGTDQWAFSRKSQGGALFAKVGRVFPESPANSMGFIGELHFQNLESPYGNRSIQADQTGAHLQFLFDHDDPLEKWAIKAGLSYIWDRYNKSLVDFDGQFEGVQNEQTPGAFVELNLRPTEKFSTLLGVRVDAHNLLGTRVSPRLHMRYQAWEGSVFRASTGLGFRSPHPWLEYGELMASNRTINEGMSKPFFEQRLRAEAAWNSGISWQQDFKLNYRKGTLLVDYFYTHFTNRLVVDRYVDPTQFVLSDLNGNSSSHSAMLQVDYEVKRRMSIRAAYKYTWAQTDYLIGSVQDPFVSAHRGFVAWFYETRSAWGFDLSGQFVGPKRLPMDTQGQINVFSPSFFLVNGQVKKSWNEGKRELYIGTENLLNFKMNNPVLEANTPGSPGFDATVVWGPIMGRVLFIGANFIF